MDFENGRPDADKAALLTGFSMTTIADLLADHHYLHWSTQLDHFITVRAGGTPYGMYKQALRELDKRERGLSGMYADRDLLQIDIDELTYCIGAGKVFQAGREVDANRFDTRRLKVNLKRKQDAIPHNEQSIRDHERERGRFTEQALAMRAYLESQGINFPLSPETRDQLDREMWIFLLKRDAAIELVTRGAIEKNTVAMIMSLPIPVRSQILDPIRQQVEHIRATQKIDSGPLLDWFFGYEPPKLPGEIVVTEYMLSDPDHKMPCSESLSLPSPSPNSSPMDAISSAASNTPAA